VDHLVIVLGWYHATLRTTPIERIAIVHIDADWYDSANLVLDVHYEKVVPGGLFIIINDYGIWQGYDKAIAELFAEHRLENGAITQVGPVGGAYFSKPM
jgi:hypothetical protein